MAGRYMRSRTLTQAMMVAATATPSEQQEHRQPDMDIGVAGADHDAVVVVQQQVAVQHVGPRLHREPETQQRRAMGDGGG